MPWSPAKVPLARVIEAAARVQIKLERHRLLRAALALRELGQEEAAQKILASLAAPQSEEPR